MNHHRRNTSSLLVACASAYAVAGLCMSAAHAATVTTNLQVSATVISACAVSATTLNFGSSINPTVAVLPIDASTTLTVQCTATTPYSVALSAGANSGGNFAARAIQNGGAALGYQLYTDALRTTVWNESTGVMAGTGSGANQSLTVYGRLPSLTGAVPGTYTDTVVVTVTY